jgi:hypothetical protein
MASAIQPPDTKPSASDERNAILDVLGQYRRAYEDHNLQQLQQIWPGMSAQQVKSLGDFFDHASGLHLNYRLLGTPTIDGDHATVTFRQSLLYVADGKPGKDSARVVMRLTKLGGTPESWRIDFIR